MGNSFKCGKSSRINALLKRAFKCMGALKMLDVKLQDVKQMDEISGHEIARHENAGHEIQGHEIACSEIVRVLCGVVHS